MKLTLTLKSKNRTKFRNTIGIVSFKFKIRNWLILVDYSLDFPHSIMIDQYFKN